MDENSELTALGVVRVAQTVKVMTILFEEPGTTIQQACEREGITPRQFSYWIRKGGESIEAVRDLIGQQQKEILVDIATARRVGIQMLIKDAIDPLMAGKDRVMVLRYLDEVQDELERIHHAKPGIEEEAVEFLRQGPLLETKKSRLAQIDLERTEDGVTINVYEEDPIIDGSISDSTEDSSSVSSEKNSTNQSPSSV